MAEGIRAKAEAFCQSYATAVNCVDSKKTEEAAKAILSHYIPKGFVSFSRGSIDRLGDHDEAASNAKRYLDRWFAWGIGLNVTLENCRVEVVSEHNALCFITWKARPLPQCGETDWEFENVYSYRLPLGQKDSRGAFEFAISDNEISSVLQRFPTFLDVS